MKTIISESRLKQIISEEINKVLFENKNTVVSTIYRDDIFNLKKFPKEILEKGYVSYSPYRLAISHGSVLQIDNNGNFLTEVINHLANAKKAKEEITKYFPIDVTQFVIAEGHHGLIAAILVANLKGNIDLIKKCMSQFNFFPSRHIKNEVNLSINGQEWVDMRFEPI